MKNNIRAAVLALGAQLVIAPAVFAQTPPTTVELGVQLRALATIASRDGKMIAVTSPAFPRGGDIPFENTQYRGNVFPGLSWSKGPAGTKSYVVIMQDTDAMVRGAPLLHWTMYNIPAGMTKLAPGMSAPPTSASFGPNIRGLNRPYLGPRTPAGPKHRYHLQVFALDTTLVADAAMTYEGLTGAMNNHVLASGEIIGLGQIDPAAPSGETPH